MSTIRSRNIGMIISDANMLGSNDATRFAWANLRRFHNVQYVKDFLIRLHSIPPAQHQNAQKQATQIRYCLIQAKEYFDAAQAVTLATKPTLMYYSIMHLALAEVLLKQSGASSLDRAREEHRHHGLLFSISNFSKTSKNLKDASEALKAAPMINAAAGYFGTFELWHRSCREMPIVGEVNTDFGTGGIQITQNVILTPINRRSDLLTRQGLSLHDCLEALPGMYEFVGAYGVSSRILRGRASQKFFYNNGNNSETVEIILHPTSQQLKNEFLQNCRFTASAVNSTLDCKDISSGAIISWREDARFTLKSMPNASMWKKNEVRFWPCDAPLNEFGYLYVALFIAGNYARYYPDLWMVDVEKSTPLALAVEELIRISENRMGLLALSELARTYYIPLE